MFGTSSKTLLKSANIPEAIVNIPTQKLATLLSKASRGQYGEKQAKRIHDAAEQSIGITIALDAFLLSLKVLLTQVMHLEEQVKRIDKEIIKKVKTQHTTLTTIPGISHIQEATILAEIGNFERFRDDKNGAENLVPLLVLIQKQKKVAHSKEKQK